MNLTEYEMPPREIRQRNYSSWKRLALIFVFVGVAILAMIPLWKKIAETNSSSSLAAQEAPIDQSAGGEFTIVGSDSSSTSSFSTADGGDSPSEKGGGKSSTDDDEKSKGSDKASSTAGGDSLIEKGGEKSSKDDDDEDAGTEKGIGSAKGENSTLVPSPPPTQQPVVSGPRSPTEEPGSDLLPRAPSPEPPGGPAPGPPVPQPAPSYEPPGVPAPGPPVTQPPVPVSTPGGDYPFVIAIPVGVSIELVYCTAPCSWSPSYLYYLFPYNNRAKIAMVILDGYAKNTDDNVAFTKNKTITMSIIPTSIHMANTGPLRTRCVSFFFSLFCLFVETLLCTISTEPTALC
jgi:hypothetical protein